MGKDFLSNVYGYHDIKRELYVIQQWYKNQTNTDNEKKFDEYAKIILDELEEHFSKISFFVRDKNGYLA